MNQHKISLFFEYICIDNLQNVVCKNINHRACSAYVGGISLTILIWANKTRQKCVLISQNVVCIDLLNCVLIYNSYTPQNLDQAKLNRCQPVVYRGEWCSIHLCDWYSWHRVNLRNQNIIMYYSCHLPGIKYFKFEQIICFFLYIIKAHMIKNSWIAIVQCRILNFATYNQSYKSYRFS
jgi:hypothetical protein